MALLGRAGAVVEILETGAVLVCCLCENSVKARALQCLVCASGAVESCPCFIPAFFLLHQLLLLFCGQRRMRVCVCVVNKCVMFPSFVGNGMKLTHLTESNLSAMADRSVDLFESSIRNIVSDHVLLAVLNSCRPLEDRQRCSIVLTFFYV